MLIDLVSPLVGWLVAQLGDAGTRLLRDNRTLKKALNLTINKVVEDADTPSREALRLGLLQCFSDPPQLRLDAFTPVGEGLRDAIAAQIGYLYELVGNDTNMKFYQVVEVEQSWLAKEVTNAIFIALRQVVAAGGVPELVRAIDAADTKDALARLELLIRANARKEVGGQRPLVEKIDTFGFIDGYLSPPKPVCNRIRQSLRTARPAGAVVFTGHSGYGKTGLAGWAARQVQKNFGRVVVVAYQEDWPKESRQEQAFEQFQAQIAGPFGVAIDPDKSLDDKSTLLILDDVRYENDLQPFVEFFDRCTALVTSVDSRIATELARNGRPFTHFDLTLPREADWISEWAGRILTQDWPNGAAVGDLVNLCGSWPLLARRLNRAVLHIARSAPGRTSFNNAIRRAETRLNELGPDSFDHPGDESRQISVRASIEFMLQIVDLFELASSPAGRFKELGALPSGIRVPVEVVDLLWESENDESTSKLIEYLSDIGMVQFEAPESGSRARGRIRLLDSDREYLRANYDMYIQEAHRRLLGRVGQGRLKSSIAAEYLAEQRIWHLIGAHDYQKLSRELFSAEFLVKTALSRGVRTLEYDLALVLALCPLSDMDGAETLLPPLLNQIRQSIDLLQQCDSQKSFCPTLAARLQAHPELIELAARISRLGEDVVIQAEGPLHDMDDSRLVRRLLRRSVGIASLSWMVGRDRIGVVFKDGSARLWDAGSNRLPKTRRPDSQRVALASWARIGGVLAIGRADGTVSVWPSPDDQGPEDLQEQGVSALAWSKKGELAYAGWAGALARWARRTGTQQIRTSGFRITAMAWSDDSAQLAVASTQGAVFVHSGDIWGQVLAEHPGGAASLTWSANGFLACAGWQGSVRVVRSDGMMPAVQPDESDPRGPAMIAWDEDGDRLGIGGFDGAVALWSDKAYRPEVLPAQSGAVRTLSWSPTAPFLAVGHDGGVIRVWHEVADRPQPLPILVAGADIVGVAWSRVEEHLVVASSDGGVAIWAPFEDSKALPSAIRTDGPTTVLCAPDGRLLATAEQAGAIRLWDLETETRSNRTLDARAAWTPAVEWAPTRAATFATGSADGAVHAWSAEQESGSTILYRHNAWVASLSWSSEGRLATIGRDWMLLIHQPPQPRCEIVAHEGGTTSIAWSPDGSLLATAGNDWLVRVWRQSAVSGAIFAGDSGNWSRVAQFRPHIGGVTALQWSPGGSELATAGWDRTVRHWRLGAAPAQSAALAPSDRSHGPTPVSWRLMDVWPTPTSPVTALAWSPDGTSVVGGDRQGKLQLWNCGDLSCRTMRSAHEGSVTGLLWPKTVNRILSVGIDGTLQVSDSSGEEQARVVFRTSMYSLDIHENSGLIAVGGEHGATILRLHANTRTEQTE